MKTYNRGLNVKSCAINGEIVKGMAKAGEVFYKKNVFKTFIIETFYPYKGSRVSLKELIFKNNGQTVTPNLKDIKVTATSQENKYWFGGGKGYVKYLFWDGSWISKPNKKHNIIAITLNSGKFEFDTVVLKNASNYTACRKAKIYIAHTKTNNTTQLPDASDLEQIYSGMLPKGTSYIELGKAIEMVC